MGVPVNTDLLIVERAGVQYQATAAEVKEFVGAVTDYSTATITTRDAGTFTPSTSTPVIGDRIFVADASGDATVDAGWAVYRVTGEGPLTFEKISEQESMDVVINTVVDLAYTPGPASGTVTNTNGDNAVIPLADGTNAGLMPPAAFNQVHPAASAGLTAATNPVVVNAGTQAVTFSISQLDPLP